MDKGKNTVESLDFVVAQFFVAFVGIALPQEFTSSTKTNFEGVSFFFFFYWSWKPKQLWNYIPTNKQTTQNPQKLAPTNLNDSTVYIDLDNLIYTSAITKTFVLESLFRVTEHYINLFHLKYHSWNQYV